MPSGQGTKNGGIWVLGLLKGSASDKAGLHQGDQILEIDGNPVDDASSFQAASLIKGKAANSYQNEKVILKVNFSSYIKIFKLYKLKKGQEFRRRNI